jgi:hypothetical protein
MPPGCHEVLRQVLDLAQRTRVNAMDPAYSMRETIDSIDRLVYDSILMTKLDAGIRDVRRFLDAVNETVTQMEHWGYSLCLRFDIHGWSHSKAQMLPGGYFSISCSFPIERKKHRSLIFGIEIGWKDDHLAISAHSEEEDEHRVIFSLDAPTINVATLDECASGLQRALAYLDTSIKNPQVVASFESMRATKNAQGQAE